MYGPFGHDLSEFPGFLSCNDRVHALASLGKARYVGLSLSGRPTGKREHTQDLRFRSLKRKTHATMMVLDETRPSEIR
jgi:autonomous glycyl radical cofactor GrcA